ncbi:hypothetical protein [Pectinatus frisingensis]|uniref:hypothetical protein n=1 Tax=Pectinatus frisingensis TaxID=865 RepID=UPI0018C5D6FB|nr:hypothetical protein [Pectinatus frisingensis]
MKKIMIIGLLAAVILTSGCQFITRKVGGTTTIDLPAGEKLEPYTVQWESSSDLWYLTRPMGDNEEPTSYNFHESSDLGELQGTVIFVEHK